MIKKEAVAKIIKLRNLLIISFCVTFALAVILTMLLEGNQYQNIILSIFVVCAFVVITVIGIAYTKSMSKCSCPHCGEGRKYRADSYFSRLLKSYAGGKSFECPKCHMSVEIE